MSIYLAFMLSGALLAAGHRNIALAQSDMPVIPPPQQRQQQQTPSTPAQRSVSIDDLARQGFDIKAIDRAGQNDARYVVMVQRGGEIRTCLMRIEVQRGQPPRRESACF
ncbi:hypothetical protein [Terrarubrum flagellatum]|uniref:hypothetical protein n=1 Tax=Terrirubrum flagellatum TaxID=2895980 RepID=UPI003144E798